MYSVCVLGVPNQHPVLICFHYNIYHVIPIKPSLHPQISNCIELIVPHNESLNVDLVCVCDGLDRTSLGLVGMSTEGQVVYWPQAGSNHKHVMNLELRI